MQSIGAYALSFVLHFLDQAILDENCIGFDGAIAMSNILSETKHMKKLSLRHNSLNRGALNIIETLQHSDAREGVVMISVPEYPPQFYQECLEALLLLPEESWFCEMLGDGDGASVAGTSVGGARVAYFREVLGDDDGGTI
ncbi:hypothetical protein THRCLA_21653 [Thraustotheca clavata]|uniref:Uncharacterized protein n=1 Tax=Thraustotheca clavata TaxID=74557 RepID=A0A1V9ZS59_9STRA|nr:hypothetical protein THRCLA_21653 [Thraustotheca clavata]